jgi:thioester reductase-like protein
VARAGGYAQSKWVAELRLREAASLGLIRLGIVRPGLLTPDTRSGSANLTDWLSRYIGGTLLLGGYRINVSGLDDNAVCHITPVDHAAALVCQLRTCADVETKSEAPAVAMYHLPLSVQMSACDLMQMVSRASATLFDRDMRELSETQWAVAMKELPDNNPLLPFRGMFESGLGGISGHCHAHTLASLKRHTIVRPDDPSTEPRPYTEEEVEHFVDFIGDGSVVSQPAVVERTASGRRFA